MPVVAAGMPAVGTNHTVILGDAEGRRSRKTPRKENAMALGSRHAGRCRRYAG